ncbi:MAG: hypothetical protein ABJJ44_09180 [Paraglaciecola sp.]|uniref:hypothetical protein n=1 Tax=Paraglaciecola sp. TaxID=1920173 RepID=UPI0032996F72
MTNSSIIKVYFSAVASVGAVIAFLLNHLNLEVVSKDSVLPLKEVNEQYLSLKTINSSYISYNELMKNYTSNKDVNTQIEQKLSLSYVKKTEYDLIKGKYLALNEKLNSIPKPFSRQEIPLGYSGHWKDPIFDFEIDMQYNDSTMTSGTETVFGLRLPNSGKMRAIHLFPSNINDFKRRFRKSGREFELSISNTKDITFVLIELSTT